MASKGESDAAEEEKEEVDAPSEEGPQEGGDAGGSTERTADAAEGGHKHHHHGHRHHGPHHGHHHRRHHRHHGSRGHHASNKDNHGHRHHRHHRHDGPQAGPEQVDDAGPPLPAATLEASAFSKPENNKSGVEQIVDDNDRPSLPTALSEDDSPKEAVKRSTEQQLGGNDAGSRSIEQIDIVDAGPPSPFMELEEGTDPNITKKIAMGGNATAAGVLVSASTTRGNNDAIPFSFNTAMFQDHIEQKISSTAEQSENNQPADEESQQVNQNPVLESNESANNVTASHSNQPNSNQQVETDEIHIPEAYLVQEEEERRSNDNNNNNNNGNIIDAEPLLPWWKQRRTRILLAFVFAIVLIAAIAIGVVTSRDQGGKTTTVTEVVKLTSSPSSSMAPTASTAPSMSPTSCWFKISTSSKALELPLADPTHQKVKMDGRNVMVAAWRATGPVQLAFYLLEDDNNGWVRVNSFTEEYLDSNQDKGVPRIASFQPDAADFHIAISGRTALLGLPMIGAGRMLVYEQGFDGTWTKTEMPLVPSGGLENAYFGYRFDIENDLIVVGSFNERAIRVFQRNDNGWVESAKLDLGFSPFGCYLSDASIIVIDMNTSMIHFYKYNQDSIGEMIAVLQDPLTVGDGEQIFNIRVTPRYLVYATSSYKEMEQGIKDYVTGQVLVYKMNNYGETFQFLQSFNAIDYDTIPSATGFGWELSSDEDILIIGGDTGTWIFAEQNGYFEDVFALEESYDQYWISGRNLIVSTDNNKLSSLSLEDCLTQMHSSSPVPSTLTTPPTQAPTLSLAPTESMQPSHFPTISSAPSLCHVVDIIIRTCADEKVYEDRGASWELYNEETNAIIQQGGPLESNQTYSHTFPCLQQGNYVFNYTDEANKGPISCDPTPGYYIFVDGDGVWTDQFVNHNQLMYFPVPYTREQQDEGKCYSDFYLLVLTDDFPEQITWVLTNEEGDTVLNGGPYKTPEAQYSVYSCLDDGKYNFTLFDSGYGKSSLISESDAGYILSTNGIQRVFYLGELIASNTTIFVTPPEIITGSSNETLVEALTSSPNVAPSPKEDLPLCYIVQISILFDNSPFGKGWTLDTADSGINIQSFSTSEGTFLANQWHNQTLCLDEGSYMWTIYDSLGQGLCCLNGNGAYVLSADDVVIAQGGQFQFSEEVRFELPAEIFY